MADRTLSHWSFPSLNRLRLQYTGEPLVHGLELEPDGRSALSERTGNDANSEEAFRRRPWYRPFLVIKNSFLYAETDLQRENCLFLKNPDPSAVGWDFEITQDWKKVNGLSVFYLWLESEIHSQYNCSAFCGSAVKFHFNRYSTRVLSVLDTFTPWATDNRRHYQSLRQPVAAATLPQAGQADRGAVLSAEEPRPKIRKVLVMISNCEPSRLALVRRLFEDDEWDYCGSCLPAEIAHRPPSALAAAGNPERGGCPSRGQFLAEETHALIGRYQYYLALENSLCENYVTEKFFKAIAANTVPMIWDQASLPGWLREAGLPFVEIRNLTRFQLRRLIIEQPLEVNYRRFHAQLLFWQRSLDPWRQICQVLNELAADDPRLARAEVAGLQQQQQQHPQQQPPLQQHEHQQQQQQKQPPGSETVQFAALNTALGGYLARALLQYDDCLRDCQEHFHCKQYFPNGTVIPHVY